MHAANGEVAAAAVAKTREQIMAEREAKRLAKLAKKSSNIKKTDAAAAPPALANDAVKKATNILTESTTNALPVTANAVDKAREEIKAEREAKKLLKQGFKAAKVNAGAASAAVNAAATNGIDLAAVTNQLKNLHFETKNETIVTAADEKKKPALSKAERRAIQEAQRAAKAAAANKTTTKTPTANAIKTAAVVSAQQKVAVASAAATLTPTKKTSSMLNHNKDCKIKLFNHLETARKDVSLFINNNKIHPSMARLGEQYAKRTIVGSNARCIGFLNALKMVIQDFETPPKKEFARSLEAASKLCVEHLQNCRPLAVSVTNAYKHIKHVLTQLPTDQPESELKQNLCHFIDTYIENQIGKAAQAISSSMQEKIVDGDVILTFGCSSLINYICEQAYSRHVNFRVIVVDSRPFCEGQELLRRLTAKEIPCTYVLINAVAFVMPEATKVLLGAHALLANGYVMARTGTAQVALVSRAFNVPVLVCCETHKFSERFQTDAIVYNEMGNPDDLVMNSKCCLTNWQAKGNMSPLNLIYDITPPELVTAVVTEVSILPCTSVPVILRIKPTEIGYYN